MGLSTEFLGFRRCGNPPCVTRGVPACDRAGEPRPSGPPSPALQLERGLGGEGVACIGAVSLDCPHAAAGWDAPPDSLSSPGRRRNYVAQ